MHIFVSNLGFNLLFMSFRFFLFLFLTVFFYTTFSQSPQVDIQKYRYADSIISFSSQYSEKGGGAAIRILGKPSASLNQTGSNEGWATEEPSKGLEYIHFLLTGEPEPIKSLHIFENLNPGSITDIIAYSVKGIDGNQQSDTIYHNPIPYFFQKKGRCFTIELKELTKFAVSELRIEINTNKVPGYNIIDAVAVSIDNSGCPNPIVDNPDFSSLEGVNFGPEVNSPFAELSPFVSSDGDVLYFNRSGHPENIGKKKLENIWKTELGFDDEADKSVLLGSNLNNEYSNFAFSITQDGNSLLLGNTYLEDGTMGQGISRTLRDGEKWGKPEAIVIDSFVNYSQAASFYVTYDGMYLFSSIDDGQSYGGTDIYVSRRKKNGNWSKPKNVGSNINTSMSEIGPFLSADGVTLYFSSDGWPGYGGVDVFSSMAFSDSYTEWMEPQNLGPGINTEGWESYFTIPLSGDRGYYVSNSNSIGAEDIFYVDLPIEKLSEVKFTIVTGVVTNAKTGRPIQADIEVDDIKTGKRRVSAVSDALTGSYQVVLPYGYNYAFRAKSEYYLPISQNLDLSAIEGEDRVAEINKDLELVQIEIGANLILNNIFFQFNSFELDTNSMTELSALAEILVKYPKVNLEISGHTDSIGGAGYNIKLSRQRAESVKGALIDLGVKPNQLKAKGKGQSEPIASNETEEGRKQNRRVELTIIK
ncbi:MAG: hypothetical protein Kapaf2KO_05130 [Candidatus Kapaibacteriales bacterium]